MLESEDLKRIKKLDPFNGMASSDFEEVMANAKLSSFAKGKFLFKRAEEDSKVYWLLSGSVDLLDEKFEAKNHKAGEPITQRPIDNNSPHHLTAIATEKLQVLTIERADLGFFGEGKRVTSWIREGIEKDSIDWMSMLLSSPLFEFIPPANIQKLFGKFEDIQVKKGQAVIKQGDKGDFFYVIQLGRAKVERRSGGKTAILAELSAGDNFGQDALVSKIPRNATVTMTTNGTVKRLAAKDFASLLMKPVIEKLTMNETLKMIKLNDPKTYIIDVRSPREAQADKIEKSLNIPLLQLRKMTSRLKTKWIYVMADEGGKRAELGAYILNENGFTAYVLKRQMSS